MRKRIVASLASLLAAAGTTLADTAPAPLPNAKDALPPAKLPAAAIPDPKPAPAAAVPDKKAAPAPGAAGEAVPPLHSWAKKSLAGSMANGEHVTVTEPAPPCKRVWASGKSLLWWTKKSPEPVPLATTAPFPPLPGTTIPGALGQPGTRVVLGGANLDTEERFGGRFILGGWLDGDQTIGVEGSYFFLAPRSVTHVVSTDGPGSILAVPIFDVTGRTTRGVPGPSTFPLLFGLPFAGQLGPINFAGTDAVTLRTRLQGAEANGIVNVVRGDSLRIDTLGGFRYLTLQDDFSFTTRTTFVPPVVLAPGFGGFFFNTADRFRADNDFYGGQVGIRAEYGLGRWVNGLSVRTDAKIALGNMHQRVDVSGSTATNQFFAGPGPTIFPGGIFAQPSNIGSHERDRFAVIPEMTVNLGYQVTGWARVFVGYTFLYVSDVARASDQLNPNINLTRTGLAGALPFPPAVGPAQPGFLFHDSSFWAQGISFGVEFTY